MDRHADRPLTTDGIPGIEQQVEQYHLQLPDIHLDQGQIRLYVIFQLDIAGQRMLQQPARGSK